MLLCLVTKYIAGSQGSRWKKDYGFLFELLLSNSKIVKNPQFSIYNNGSNMKMG